MEKHLLGMNVYVFVGCDCGIGDLAVRKVEYDHHKAEVYITVEPHDCLPDTKSTILAP